MKIYEIGKALPLPLSIASVDKKLKFVLFPYDSKAVINTSLAVFASIFLLGLVVSLFSLLSSAFTFVAYVLFFFGLILGMVTYLYPTSIFYGHRMGEYNEEMLRAIMRLSTFISMDTSLEYAFFETADHLHGTLRVQFQEIKNKLRRKSKMTLGDAINDYVDIWNEVNPVFVKSLRLLQTASLSEKEDKETILKETSDTLLLNYTTLGKRFAEQLTNNAKKLVSIGVLFPIMTLMLLPLLSVFMPEFIKPPLLAFLYVILFPSLTLLMALSFASKRIQVDTVRIQEAYNYQPVPMLYLWIPLGIAAVLSIPTIVYLYQISQGTAGDTETLFALFMGWMMSAALFGAVYLYAFLYERKYRKLWNEVYEIEQDLPHLLQSFSTYLTLNISTENVIPEVINDYERFGFAKHPVVTAFKKLQHKMMTSKKSIESIVTKDLKTILPSRKVVQILSQIVSFSSISQRSSARVTKMIREQTIGIYKLDDYMKTLLAESVGLINVTTTMLAPLLCAAAVIMSVAIVKSLVFITEQLESIASVFGVSGDFSVALVDTSAIINPIFIEVVVGLYLVFTIFTLSLFGVLINVGNDWYKFFESIKNNALGFLIYTVILFGGYFFIVRVFFTGVLGMDTG